MYNQPTQDELNDIIARAHAERAIAVRRMISGIVSSAKAVLAKANFAKA